MEHEKGHGVNEFDLPITSRLRARLKPRGSAPIVYLNALGDGIDMHPDFIAKCINELDAISDLSVAGVKQPSNLEKLAFRLLLDSAYISLDHDRKQREFLKREGFI